MPYNGKKIVLCILDGFALGDKNNPSNAVAKAKMPNLEYALKNYPNTELFTSGEAVGLDAGQMGNSEVGHMTIGAGKIIQQDLPMINTAVAKNQIKHNQDIKNAIQFARENKSNIHIIGLYSNGGVHSHMNHIHHLAEIFAAEDLPVNLHIITDGRDVPPSTFFQKDWEILDSFTREKNVKIATIMGRYFAMDRDNKYNRTRLASDAIIFAKAEKFTSLPHFIKNNSQVADEFIPPVAADYYPGISPNDVVIFANFRVDRMRQLLKIFAKDVVLENGENIPAAKLICAMEYYQGLSEKSAILFAKQEVKNSLAHVYSNLGLSQVKIAETEKYPHVTFFFNGGKESLLPKEERIMIKSPDVTTYDLKPEMSAYELRDVVVAKIAENTEDLMIINVANGDMVGHTGNFAASVKAAEVLDELIGNFIQAAKVHGHCLIITADHGNIEEMLDNNGEIHTQHTLNPVPIIFCDEEYFQKNFNCLQPASLANIAPTILKICNIDPQDGFEKPLF